MCLYYQGRSVHVYRAGKRNIFYIYIYMYITLLMRRRLTKNRIYTTFRRTMEREG